MKQDISTIRSLNQERGNKNILNSDKYLIFDNYEMINEKKQGLEDNTEESYDDDDDGRKEVNDYYQNLISLEWLKRIETNSPYKIRKASNIGNRNCKTYGKDPLDKQRPAFYPKKYNLEKDSKEYDKVYDRNNKTIDVTQRNGIFIPPLWTPQLQSSSVFSDSPVFQLSKFNDQIVRNNESPLSSNPVSSNCIMNIHAISPTSDISNSENIDPNKEYLHNNGKHLSQETIEKNKIKDATKINLSIREITQINQMKYNQLKKISWTKEVNSSEQYGIESNTNKKKKKPFSQRVGDWLCIQCKNLNFSFRSSCNRCKITKTENEGWYEQYMKNLLNYCSINKMWKSQFVSESISFVQWLPNKNTMDNLNIKSSK